MRDKPGKTTRTEAAYGGDKDVPAAPGKSTRAEERYADGETSDIGRAESIDIDSERAQPGGGGGAGGGGGGEERASASPLDAPLLGFMDAQTEHEDLGLRSSAEEARWERDLGRRLTEAERVALAKSGVDLSVLDLTGDGRPPLDHTFDTFEEARAFVERQNRALDALRADPATAELVRDRQAVLFAVMHWTSQPERPGAGAEAEPDGLEYRARPGAARHDYGFWSEASQSFWMARHDDPGMAAYQAPRDRIGEGHGGVERVQYGVAMASGYDPAAAAVDAAVGTADGAAVDRT
ncbi:MAG TPA: hypothetical protein VMZ28_24085 [Kofleriaceae bacterium]|nr:hypothetical protein [Kofleriaceae bacterium]